MTLVPNFKDVGIILFLFKFKKCGMFILINSEEKPVFQYFFNREYNVKRKVEITLKDT